jgi:hypothetical protein
MLKIIIKIYLPIGPCDSDPCINGGKCTVVPFSYTCACADGWKGSVCTVKGKPYFLCFYLYLAMFTLSISSLCREVLGTRMAIDRISENARKRAVVSKAHNLELGRFSTGNNFHRHVLRRNEVFAYALTCFDRKIFPRKNCSTSAK